MALLVAVMSILALLSMGAPTALAGGNHLEFGQDPTGQIAGMAITPAITVLVMNNSGNLVDNGPDSEASITIAIASGGSNSHLFGTTTVNAVDGVATFSNVKIDLAGTYTLGASAEGIEGATSDPFEIRGVAAKCQGSGCKLADSKANASNKTSWSVNVTSCPTVDDDTFLSAEESSSPSTDFCGGGACFGNKVFFTSECLTGDPNVLTTSTLSIHKSALPLDKGAPHLTVWFQGPTGDPFALAKCPKSGIPTGKACILSQTKSSDGTILIQIVSKGDPSFAA